MGVREDIVALAEIHGGGEGETDPETDLLGAYRLVGDRREAFFDAFAARYGADLEDLRRAPARPIPLADLVEAAEAGLRNMSAATDPRRGAARRKRARWLVLGILLGAVLLRVWHRILS